MWREERGGAGEGGEGEPKEWRWGGREKLGEQREGEKMPGREGEGGGGLLPVQGLEEPDPPGAPHPHAYRAGTLSLKSPRPS